MDETLADSRKRADTLTIGPKSRILSTLDWTLPAGVLDGFLAVLAAGASLVHVTNPDPAKLPTHRSTERTTLDLP